jgi:hypothetical protein
VTRPSRSGRKCGIAWKILMRGILCPDDHPRPEETRCGRLWPWEISTHCR